MESSSSCRSLPPPSADASPAVSTSSCTTETARGMHHFHVHHWSLFRGLGAGEFIRSGTFNVGDYRWAVRLYPSGDGSHAAGDVDHLTVCVELMSPNVEVRAWCHLRLVDPATGRSHCFFRSNSTLFSTKPVVSDGGAPMKAVWLKKSSLEAPTSTSVQYLQDDHLAIRCVLGVIREPHVFETRPLPHINPPSNICKDFSELLREKDGTEDITFHVDGEVFAAHRAMLIARSPVFKAELRGPMRENMSGHVDIQDVQPVVFKAMLDFIYTDEMPKVVDDLDGDDRTEMLCHLLAAANQYGIERLKRLCESMLCSNLDEHTIYPTRLLANKYGCDELRMACHEFSLLR